jgi:hypothetical protein
MADKMCEWVQNELYSELIQMPLWTVSAFGNLEEGHVLAPCDTLYKLIIYLVVKQMNKKECPYDSYHRHNWHLSEYRDVFKSAVNKCNQIIDN